MASKPHRLTEVSEQTAVTTGSAVGEIRLGCKRLWNVLEYSSAYLAVIAMAKVFIVMFVLSLSMSPAPIVAGLVTFAVYANDRLIDRETDSASNPERAEFVARHANSLYVLAALAYGLGVALSVLGGPVAFALVILPGAAWVVYAHDWIPAGGINIHRLKDVLFVNSALVATAWAVPVVVVPIAFADGTFGPTAGVLLVYLFFGTFVNAEIANARDIESDSRNGVVTMPVAFGLARTRQFLYLLTLVTAVVPGYAALAGYLSPTVTAVLLTGPAFLIGVLSFLGRSDDEDLVVLAAEFTRIPAFLLLAAPGLVG